ncbi:MAG: radical SAM protein [archaeon]
MKIQFVFAPPVKEPLAGQLSEGIWPPMGILYLAGYIRDRVPKTAVKITDGLLLGYEETVKDIISFTPDMLCISYVTLVATDAYKLIDQIKSQNPRIVIITGGPHATALPKEAIEESRADITVIGEGEETLRELVVNFKGAAVENLSAIKGIVYRDNNIPVVNEIRPYITDIDSIPVPAWDLVNINNYRGWFLFKQKPEASIFMSRGCPFDCTYCSNQVWNCSSPKLRLRLPAKVADEFEYLHKRFGFKEFFDNSDEFNNDISNANNICKELVKRNLKISWKTQMRAAPISEELVANMKEAGCWYVHLGIESVNPKTVKGIRKYITREQVIHACKLLKKYDIKILGLFMFNNVWETKGKLEFETVEDSKKTLRFARMLVRKRLLDFIAASITTPYPGSELYDIAVRHKLIKPKYHKKWDKWLREDYFIMKLPGVDESQQARLRTKAYLTQFMCMVRSGNIGIKDAGYFLHKGLQFVKNELSTR